MRIRGIGFASYTLNRIVRKSFGFEFRSDWDIAKDCEDEEIRLERGRLPNIIARASLWLPAWLDNGEIIGQVSSNGSRIFVHENYERNLATYEEEYFKVYRTKPEMLSMPNERFFDHIRNYGKQRLE